MIRGGRPSVALAAFAGVLVSALMLVACSLAAISRPLPQAPGRASAVPAELRISQLEFGRNARFATCAEPACPTITRKTLAITTSAAVPPTAELLPAALPALPAKATLAAQSKPAFAPERVALPQKLVLYFATDSAALTVSHKTLLRGALTELRQTDRIVIAGRTDNLGGEERNQSLAFARALAIRDYLLELAPDLPARIAIDAKGRCCYVASNETSDGRSQNRRVELAFTLPAEARP